VAGIGPDRTVAHVIAPAAFGGAESVVRALASGRQRLGGRTEVIALVEGDGPHPFVDDLRGMGVSTHGVSCGRRRYWAEARAVADLLCRLDARVVHTHVYHGDVVGYWAARSRGRSVVATVHNGFVGGDWKNRLYEWADRRLLRRFDAVMCVSHDARTRLVRSGAPPSRVALVCNGYDGRGSLPRCEARRRLGAGEGIKTIGWVGRLSQEKGPDLFIRALVLARIDRAMAVMLGSGEEQSRLTALAASLGLGPDSLRMVGQRDAGALMSGFDVLVMSSRTEGLPMVLLEAMAAGRPVVAFAVGGIAEVLSAESGWLVPPGDVSGLARAIGEALGAPEEAERRAVAARRLIESRFGLEQWVESVEAVYATAERTYASRRA
jgi:glycosyltransferase involved in cell wall biosynthesis